MRSYPWYEINGLTREVEPYARYSYHRVNFERYYQPELSPGTEITTESLENSISSDEERYHWMLGEPLMRDFIHMLWCKPAELTRFAKINAEYMAGFRKKTYREQARIHMMTACLIVGETYEDDAVTKKLLRDNATILWARAWLRDEWFRSRPHDKERFSPTAAELETVVKTQLPFKSGKFPWPEVVIDLGLSDLPQSGKQTHKAGPGIFSWIMRSDPENHDDVSGLLDALDCIDDEHTK